MQNLLHRHILHQLQCPRSHLGISFAACLLCLLLGRLFTCAFCCLILFLFISLILSLLTLAFFSRLWRYLLLILDTNNQVTILVVISRQDFLLLPVCTLNSMFSTVVENDHLHHFLNCSCNNNHITK